MDDLIAVQRAVGLTTHVNPINLPVGCFLDELVEVGVVHQPYEPFVEQIGVGKRLSVGAPEREQGQTDISCFACQMLRVGRASYGLV